MAVKWIKLFIQCFVLSTAKCDSHSLQFLSTGHEQPGRRPLFEQLTVFDGVPISHCDSWTKKEEFKPALESSNLPVKCDEASYTILEFLHRIPPLNSTVYVQRRRGCILSANGSVSAFDVWAVNGVDFISFNAESQRWTSHSPMAGTVKQRWNNNNARNSALRNFIREQCPLLIHGIKLRSTQQSTELRVFAKPIVNTDQALLRCHVTSTDKSVSSVHLIEPENSKASWVTVTGPVPSQDGSMVLRLTAEIPLSSDFSMYGCRVQTGGHNITVFWDGNTLDGRHLLNVLNVHWKIVTAILGFCCVSFAITVMSCGIIYLHKCVKKKKFIRGPRIAPQLIEQFVVFQRSVTSADLSNVIVALIQGTERSTVWGQWAQRTALLESELYHPEYFAHQIEGALK
uniref:major histocompatibility complex class I-related gene protein-like isoform X3 n=1 Tax=Scatophagus argus TaxID=75038 RepID=UPI001ED80E25|nr:major histocompatibility complex class I-related gene protein-like isoform X3 [Scatophagus argus]